ncbi:hypothetical protein AusDCA_2394 [Desulfitobacterium sp. AusDCA]
MNLNDIDKIKCGEHDWVKVIKRVDADGIPPLRGKSIDIMSVLDECMNDHEIEW